MSYHDNLTKKYTNAPSPGIIGRDRELELLMLTLLRNQKPNAILTGHPGVGKTSLIHQLAWLIANELCPKELKGFKVVEINTNKLLAGPGYRGVVEQKFEQLIDSALEDGKVILFMDEFHTVEHLGEMANGQTPGLGNTLKPFLTRPDFRVIGATTVEEMKHIKDAALLRRFFVIDVKEPTEEAVKQIIKACLIEYGGGVTFSKETIELIYDLSLQLDRCNPDKSKDIADMLCSYCRLKSIRKVDSEIVLSVFDKFFNENKPAPDVQKQFGNVIFE